MKIILRLILIIITVSVFAQGAVCHAYWVWTPETKRWVNPKYAPKDTPKEQLLYAMDFFESTEYKKALAEFKKIIKYYRRSEAASEAQYYTGRCYEALGNPYHGFESYQKVIDDYPFTNRTEEIVTRQFDIGNRLFEGEKTKYVGVSFKAFPEQIVEVYKKVVSNAPYGKNAPNAQFKIGELYKRMGFYVDAREAFEKIVADYPDSDIITEAKFQVALCASIASGGSAYDQTLAEQAMREFEEFAKENPDSQLVKEALKEKGELTEKRAIAHMNTAKFYERAGKHESALLYYNKVVDGYPDSSVAASALEKAEVIEKRLERQKR